MDHLQELVQRYPKLKPVTVEIKAAFDIIKDSYNKGGKLLIAGNGGSASDAEHIVGEMMKSFIKKRKIPDSFIADIEKIDSEIAGYLIPRLQPGMPAIALSNHVSLNTACINDIDGNIVFAQQVYGYGKKDDVLLAITTSGNSKNIMYAAVVARVKKLKIIGLTGNTGGKIKEFTDVCICAPETETHKIQELHLPIYHTLCMMLEDHFF